jgi:MYXO-CTERM domain-containing protein
MGKKQTLALLAGSAIFGVALPARADYAEAAKQRMAEGAAHNLGFTQAPVLLKQKLNTREETIRVASKITSRVLDPSSTGAAFDAEAVNAERQRLLKTLTTPVPSRFRLPSTLGKLSVLETEDGTTLSEQDVFNLRVYRDGSAFRLSNRAYDSAENPEFRLTEVEAQSEGLRIIKELGLIPEADFAQLEFVKTRYLQFSGNAADPGQRSVATEVYFARNVGGIPVIGPKGSSIRIELRREPVIRRIVVDWMPVAVVPGSTPVQKPVDSERFARRFYGYLKSALGTQVDPAAVSIDRKVCGYVDFGSAYTDQEVLQLGCMVVYRQAGSGDAEITFLPLAEEPVSGQGFPDAAELERLGGEVAVSQLKLQALARPITAPGPSASPGLAAPPISPQAGCSVTHTRAPSSSAVGLLGLLFLGLLSRRRLQGAGCLRDPQTPGRRKKLATAAVAATCWLVATPEAQAQYMTVLHNKNFPQGTVCGSIPDQWAAYNSFVDEMDDVATCNPCYPDSVNFAMWMNWGIVYSDLLAVASHGGSNYNENTGMWENWVRDKSCTQVFLQSFDAFYSASPLDIILLGACNVFSTDNYWNWTAVRNMLRTGPPVTAGCYGLCAISSNMWGNNTWNEIGDSLADSNETVMEAWDDGFNVYYYDDHIIWTGVGWVGSDWCAWELPQVTWANRHGYKGAQYGYDQPWSWTPGDPEPCNYYWCT